MKTKIFVLVLFAMFLPSVFVMSACKPKDPPPTHVGELEWSIDNEYHWHECNQQNCLEVFDKQVHLFNSGVQTTLPTCDTQGVLTYTCIICNHTKTENLGYGSAHTTNDEWQTSATEHWKVSTCAHNVIVQQASHIFDANNICITCNYESYTQGIVFEALSDENLPSCEYAVKSFENNNVTEVVIPSTYKGKPVSKILKNAFSSEKKLDKVTIGKNVRVIEEFAFAMCDTLNDIVFKADSKLDTIDNFAFYDSTYLENIVLPQSLKTLKKGAFSFTGIKAINIPKNVSTIDGYFLFRGCYDLSTITVDSANQTYKAVNNCLIEKNKNLVVAGCNASQIPNNITELGTGAFAGIGENLEITIPASVQKIGADCFFGSMYKKIKFQANSNLTYIDDYAFGDCLELTEITIPANVTHIGQFAFYVQYANTNQSKLKNIIFEQTSGWYITSQKDGTTGTQIVVTDSSDNAWDMSNMYSDAEYFNYYIKRK